MATVSEIVAEYLERNGYDGLFNSSGECACKLGDLFPCYSESTCFCQAGHLIPCPGPEGCEAAEYGECSFHIGPKKRLGGPAGSPGSEEET